MAHIGTCTICGILTCDTSICSECKDVIAFNSDYDKEEIKKKVNDRRLRSLEESHREMMQNRKCNQCGRTFDDTKY